jgi:hypothetical protein
MANLCDDIFDKIMNDAVQIANMNKNKTISPAEIQTAARLLLTGQLRKYGVIEANKAVKSTPPFCLWSELVDVGV